MASSPPFLPKSNLHINWVLITNEIPYTGELIRSIFVNHIFILKYLFALIGTLILQIQTSRADFLFTDNCKKAYTEIMALRLQKAIPLLQAEKKENPNNDFPYLLENYIDFLVLSIGEEKAEFEARKGNKDFRLNRIQKGAANSPYYLYAQAETHLLWAMARLKFGEYLTAASEANKAYHLLVQNEKRYPDFIPNKNALGQMHCIIGIIPSQFKWAVKMIGMDGTIPQGIGELRQVLNVATTNPEYGHLWPETAFFLTFLELNLHKDERVINDLYLIFKKRQDHTPLMTFCLASIAMKTGHSTEAIECLNSREKGADYFPFYYLDFLSGLAKANHLDPSANASFTTYIANFKGKNYIKSAYQKMAWVEFVNGNPAAYRSTMEKLKTVGYSDMDEDKVAQKEAESGLFPNPFLLKARMLCDGGYYKEALAALIDKYDSDNFITNSDQTEFTYRLGRIYHLWKKPDQAINYYKLTIDKGRKSKHYFACNSALQLGIIYEDKGDKPLARTYYELCLKLPTDEYKGSLDTKAKAGLQRVK